MKDYTGQIIVQAPTEVINFLHNEKRAALAEVESRHKVPIVMLANQYLVTPHFEILRVKKSDVSSDPSYARIDRPEGQVVANARSQATAIPIPAPAVKAYSARPACTHPDRRKCTGSLFPPGKHSLLTSKRGREKQTGTA